MADDDDHLGSGLSSFVRMTGTNVPARARFTGEAIVSATFSSLTFGMFSGGLGAVLAPISVGPLVPFMVGSAVGYSFGLYQMWANCKRRMLWYARQYPVLLAHSLRIEQHIIVPSSIIKTTKELVEAQRNEEGEEYQMGDFTTQKASEGGPNTMDQWILAGGLGRITWAILAAQECSQDAVAIQKQQRQNIVDSFDNNGGDDDDN